MVINASMYDVFEQMHWLCFHLEFEHQTDPDEECGDPSCPWWKIQVFRQALVASGQDPDEIMGAAIEERRNCISQRTRYSRADYIPKFVGLASFKPVALR